MRSGPLVLQVNLVWDVMLWAGALRGNVCSQDAVADLLQVWHTLLLRAYHWPVCQWPRAPGARGLGCPNLSAS